MARQISWRGVLSPDGPGASHPEPAVWRPGTPLVPPRSIVDAVRLMQFGAVLEVAEIVRGFATRDQLRAAIVHDAAAGRLVATDADVDRVLQITLTVTTVTAAVACVIWLVMSRITARGSRSGRIVASGLFALDVGSFVGALLPTAGTFGQTFALAILVIGAWAVVRLWHRDSSAYIRYQTRPQDD
ncbi:hypothetical protein BJ986_001171 [Phycicoccus badiiscoriae]|uniref:Uncharacterized protein n=1 Tax=Pedococcus badiiscoriae TaxID=642776 RepID=A0A852WJ62_9MICO|nr:hypothetical protein [Pedococcus badiiscoriae]NYG06684.1 hypothetical protein [Pedococcus badiiscoriae]